jgi:nitrous oxidase accessory protein
MIDNLTQVVVSSGMTANRNLWEGNHWSDYEGFDEDRDGIGDTTYELYVYADRIWKDLPYAQFFKGSPLLEVMDFLERLAPFTEPHVLVRDDQPVKQRALEKLEQKTKIKDSLDILRQSLGR